MAYSALSRLWAKNVMEKTKGLDEVPEKYLNDVISILKDNDRYDLLEGFESEEGETPDSVKETE